MDWIEEQVRASADTVLALLEETDGIAALSEGVVSVLRAGNKVLTAGNGGSAAEAMHFAEELVGRFRTNRVSLPSVSLAADATVLTCIGNDFGFDALFSRQVEGLGLPGDLLLLFSTSGSARNLALALEGAAAKGMKTACILGRDGGALAGRADYEVIVPGKATERIQEAHQVLVHLVLDAVERAFPIT